MHPASTRPRAVWSQAASFLLWTVLFALAYAQSPLYTSNQNQYFLHGLARAGYGLLEHDWLANALDPTPVFSALVELIYRFTQLEILFYLIYALLMGCYFVSLAGIVEDLFPQIRQSGYSLVLRAGLVVLHSAAWRFGLSRLLSANWSYLLEDGVADQRMLGPVLQPSVFGVLLMLSVWLYLRKRPRLAVLSAVLAATFHPTYLLAAGLLTGAYLLGEWLETRRLGGVIATGGLALLAVLPIAWYAWGAFSGTTPEQALQSRQILIQFRIPHHVLIEQWFDLTAVIKLGIVLAALWLVRRTHLGLVLAFTGAAVILLTAIQAIFPTDTLGLLFPWRLSVLLVPLSTGILLAAGLVRLPESAGLQRWMRPASLLLLAAVVLVGVIRFGLDLNRKASDPATPLYQYVYAQRTSADVYLIPVKLQDFRLTAGAPAYIDFKSIPYRDLDVLEWYRRERLADRFYLQSDCTLLSNFAAEGVTHLVVDLAKGEITCPQLEQVYRDNSYALYALTP